MEIDRTYFYGCASAFQAAVAERSARAGASSRRAGKPALVVIGRSSNGHFVNSFRDSFRHGRYLKGDKETRRNVDESVGAIACRNGTR